MEDKLVLLTKGLYYCFKRKSSKKKKKKKKTTKKKKKKKKPQKPTKIPKKKKLLSRIDKIKIISTVISDHIFLTQ